VERREASVPRHKRVHARLDALWDARRLARRLAYRVISAFTRVFEAHDTPHGCLARTRTFLGAPPTPRLGVSEAKVASPRAQKCAAGTMECVLLIRSRGSFRHRVVPAKAGTHNHRRWLWVPALAALGRDDDGLGRTKNQPAAVRNRRRRSSLVSGLLFTMSGATATCRAFQRPSRIQVAARLPTRSRSPINPANTGSTPMPRTTLASRVRSPSQSSPW
jgi:hypothetical protein